MPESQRLEDLRRRLVEARNHAENLSSKATGETREAWIRVGRLEVEVQLLEQQESSPNPPKR